MICDARSVPRSRLILQGVVVEARPFVYLHSRSATGHIVAYSNYRVLSPKGIILLASKGVDRGQRASMTLHFRKASRDGSSTQDKPPTEVTMQVLEDKPKPAVSRYRAKWIYFFMLLMHFMLAIDTTSVAVALPVRSKTLTMA